MSTVDQVFDQIVGQQSIDDVDFEGTREAVDNLMGTKADARFRFIQERAAFADNLDI